MKLIKSIPVYFSALSNNSLIKNSSWGIVAQISQTIFLTLFFVILARKYDTHTFAIYIIANALYQLVSAFSTMGLSQWFIREFISSADREGLTSRFLKMQVYFGLGFYAFNILLAYFLYDDQLTRYLIILMGFNVIFDNLINAIKCLNIANLEQKKTFVILTIEVVLKFAAACVLFSYPLSIITLSIVLIGLRFLTLNLFLSFGSSSAVSIKLLMKFKVKYKEVRDIVIGNWAFIIIGGVAIINWRIANIIISKSLSAYDLANYEISFKIFSIAQILPVVVSTSVFPMLVKAFTNKSKEHFVALYKQIHLFYMLFGLLSYTFIYSFAGQLIPIAFGDTYQSNAGYTKEMFLTILLFPTALLQANLLITMKLEKLDMVFNIIALAINVSMCFIGLQYFKTLSMVNYSIFTSFLIFHIVQDIVLIRRKLITVISAFSFYLISAGLISVYVFFSGIVNPYILFIGTWLSILILMIMKSKLKGSKGIHLLKSSFAR